MALNILALLEAVCYSSPRSRLLLSSKIENLQAIVQVIPIIDNKAVTNQAVILLSQILNENRIQQPLIYKTGLFHFLMLQMKYGCNQILALLLRQYHHIQSDNQKSKSYLEYFLPTPLIALLERQDDKGAELFCDAMNTNASNTFLIWSSEHREKMIAHVESELQPFFDMISKSDNVAFFEYKTPTAICYDDIEKELCIKNIYVKRFIEIPNYDVSDPQEFLKGLIEAMSTEQSQDRIELLISAQLTLYKKQKLTAKQEDSFVQYPGYSVLSSLLYEDLQQVQKCHLIAARICELLACMFEHPDEVSLWNRSRFVSDHNGLNLMEHVVKMANNEQNVTVSVLRILSSVAALKDMDQIIQKQAPSFITLICKLCLDTREIEADESKAEIAVRAAHWLQRLVTTQNLQLLTTMLLESLFSLIDVAVLLDYGKTENMEHAKLQRTACQTCVQLLIHFKQSPQFDILLQRLLTQNMSNKLQVKSSNIIETVEQFMKQVRSNYDMPSLIWNDKMRQELKDFINANRSQITRPIDSFAFETLKNEIVIENIYLRPFNRECELKNPEVIQSLAVTSMDFIASLFSSIFADYHKYQQKQSDEAIASLTIKIATLNNIASVMSNQQQFMIIQQYFTSPLRQEQFQKSKALLDLLSIVLLNENNAALLQNLLKLYSFLGRFKHVQLSQLAESGQQLDMSSFDGILLQSMSYSMQRYLQIHQQAKPESTDTELTSQVVGAIADMCNVCSNYANLLCTHASLIFTFLHVMIQPEQQAILRQQCARVISAICLIHPQFKQVMLQQILMPKFEQYLVNAYESPDLLIYYFDEKHETPEIVWNSAIRMDMIQFLQRALAMSSQQVTFNDMKGLEQFIVKEFDKPNLQKEMKVGNVFVKCFNKNPTYKLSMSPSVFLNQLLQTVSSQSGNSKAFELIANCWKAIENLLTINSPKIAQQFASIPANISLLLDHLLKAVPDVQKIILRILAQVAQYDTVIDQFNTNKKFILNLLRTLFVLDNEELQIMTLTLMRDMIVSNSQFVLTLKQSGGILYIIYCLLSSQEHIKSQELSADCIISLAADPQYKKTIQSYLCKVLLTDQFMLKFESQPAEFVRFFFAQHKTQARLWNKNVRELLSGYVQKTILEMEQHSGDDEWITSQDHYDRLDDAALQSDINEQVYTPAQQQQ